MPDHPPVAWSHAGPLHVATADALTALASLPEGLAHAVLTDPPYCSGGATEAARQQSAGMTKGGAAAGWFRGDTMTTWGLLALLRQVALDARRVLVPGGSLAVFCDWRMVPGLAPALESAGYRWRSTLVWDKLSQGQGNVAIRNRHETILWLTAPGPMVRGPRTIGTVVPAKRVPPAKRRHPTEKPRDLLAPLIEALVPEGGAVVDPFAGSGAVGETAAALGRSAWISDATFRAFRPQRKASPETHSPLDGASRVTHYHFIDNSGAG